MPSTSNHFVDTDLILVETVKKRQCQRHYEKTYTNFCEICNYLVCSDCLSEAGHSGHKMGRIEKFITEKVDGNSKHLSTETPRKESFNDSGFFDTMTEYSNEDESGTNMQRQDRDNDNQKDEMSNYSANPSGMPQGDFELIDNVTKYLPMVGNLSVIRTVTTNVPTIDFIASVSKDGAWIGGRDGNILKKINLHKLFGSKQIDQIKGCQPLDISVNTGGDILFVNRFHKGVKIVKTNSKGLKQVCDLQSINLSTLEPICIHCSKTGDNNIWIGVTEGGPDFEPPLNCSRKVIEINEVGEILNIYEVTKANKRLFTLPWRVVNTGNGVCVIDKLNPVNGRVISLSHSGHLKWIYTDRHPSFSNKAFFPSDLAVTSLGNIIVCDSANSSLHILNEKGTLMWQPYLTNLNIMNPLSLNIDSLSGNLWIGTMSDSNAKNKKAKIHEINMHGL